MIAAVVLVANRLRVRRLGLADELTHELVVRHVADGARHVTDAHDVRNYCSINGGLTFLLSSTIDMQLSG